MNKFQTHISMYISSEFPRNLPSCEKDLTDDQSTLVQVKSWCHQANTITLINIDQYLLTFRITDPLFVPSQRALQYIPRYMHTVFALLCFAVVINWLIVPHPSGLLHWHCGNLMIAPVPAKQPWWIWINTSCEFIMNDCITTTKQSTTKPCAYFLGCTVSAELWCSLCCQLEHLVDVIVDVWWLEMSWRLCYVMIKNTPWHTETILRHIQYITMTP